MPTLRLMHYNVLYDTIHLELLEEIIASENPDILTLNEVQWPEMKLLSKRYRTAFAQTTKEGREYGNGIAWKPHLPLRSLRTIVQEFKTPLLEWQTDQFTLYVTHLAAKEGEQQRLREIQKICSLAPAAKEYLICGDLNALSPHDKYNTEELEAKMKQHGHAKFGIPVQFLAIPYLEQQQLVDLLRRGEAVTSTVPTTAGTPEHERAQHFMPLRLDYIFATPHLAQTARRADVLKNELTEKCSDHYPLVVELELDR